ncbi:hypothetical protein EAF04_010654 [Stromatinia cepivora]|nr:hypothetical protein EAF04_010654 [Stromatinia cepivora]
MRTENMTWCEQENLLDKEGCDNQVSHRTQSKSIFGLSPYAFITHSIFLISYVIITVVPFLLEVPSKGCSFPGADIIQDSIHFESQFLHVDIGHNSPYTGPPSYEIDLAWHNLFENANLRISATEMKQMNRTSVALADGNGYMANLDIHHQLHCLKFLRWYVYPEYYDFRLNATTTRHADHCIENLRRNFMCLPSLELMMFDWEADKVHPQPHFSYEHKCVNWDRIDAWTRKRSFNYFNESLLINPILAPTLVTEENDECFDGGVDHRYSLWLQCCRM